MQLAAFTRRQLIKLLSAMGFYGLRGISQAAVTSAGDVAAGVRVPTFYEDIKPLFTHYDRLKMMYLLDVWDYQQVKALATRILASLQEDPSRPGWSLLPRVRLMPLYTGPWPSSHIALFKAWIEGGCVAGATVAAPQPSSQLADFLSVSQGLTGFDDLGESAILGQSYLDLIRSTSTEGELNSLFAVWKPISGLEQSVRDNRTEREIVNNDSLGGLAKRIILIWYTGCLYRADESIQQLKEGYVEGLVWRAIKAHPIGYANETYDFYWKDRPNGDRYTGLDLAMSRMGSRDNQNADV